jgi:hypothetical protein
MLVAIRIVAILSTLRIVLFLPLPSFSSGYVSRIVSENSLQGSRDWWYPQANETPSILGFTTSFSYYPGDLAVFKVSATSVYSRISLRIYRTGYYNGDGARLITTVDANPIIAAVQPSCSYENESRMVDCSDWVATANWRIFDNCTSGVYFALPFTMGPNSVSVLGGYIPFVVLQSTQSLGSKILFKTSDTTWVAYNKYGGWNVYRGNGSFAFASRAYKASYNRPFLNRALPPNGQFQNFLFGAEFAMIYWLEQYGYDVSYTSCAGMEVLYESRKLTRQYFQAIFSVGHDEYWSEQLKEAHYSARDAGIHLAFFSGNEAYWQIRWDNINGSEVSKRNDSHDIKFNGLRSHGLDDNKSQRDIDVHNRHRVFLCAKETLDNRAPSSARSRDWTGTFVDSRHRKLSCCYESFAKQYSNPSP